MTLGIVDDGYTLSVRAPVSWYVIEPIRLELGLSRVQMVDDHLARLTHDHRQFSEDSDVLLEARAVFAAEVGR